ncbi:MAG: N-acetyltransferase [Cyanobacteriota bacterium]|nr:N-acetyltransferase [Cyanobacteriota bacterium]
MSPDFLPGYSLQRGSSGDRPWLVKFAAQTYRELEPDRDFSDIDRTIEQYWSPETSVWFVEVADDRVPIKSSGLPRGIPHRERVGCLWLGNALDRISGERHTHILLVYVVPEHRRRGIGTKLIRHAEAQARERGDRQIGLQVFANNQPALELYRNSGYQPLSFWMAKSL